MKKWVFETEISKNISAQILDNGTNIHADPLFEEISGFKKNSTILTNHFYNEVNKILSRERQLLQSENKPLNVLAYRYYKKGNGGSRSSNGGGRDHIITQNKEQNVISFKGSGINEVFIQRTRSKEINFKNFRQNGLQTLEESLLEYIVSSNFEEQGIPIIKHIGLTALPENVQEKLSLSGGQIATQTIRMLNKPRHSFSEADDFFQGKVQSNVKYLENKEYINSSTELLAKAYLNNIGHGALNPENIATDATFLDMGHVSFGYPVLSGAYRCYMCAGVEGSSKDGDYTGLWDYFIERSRFSYSFRYRKDIGNLFMTKVFSTLKGKPVNNNVILSSNLHKVLKEVLREEIKLSEGISKIEERETQDLLPGNRQSWTVEKVQKEIWGLVVPEDLWPQKPSVSFKFFMQITAASFFFNPVDLKEFDRIVVDFLLKNYNGYFKLRRFKKAMIEMRTLLKNEKIEKSHLDYLFKYQLPSNLILKDIRESLSGLDYESALIKSREIYKKYSVMKQVDPLHFYNSLFGLKIYFKR